MKRLFVSIAVATGLLALVGAAQAKGPVELEVSGGAIEDPVRIEGEVQIDELYPATGYKSVSGAMLEGEEPYAVDVIATDPEAGAEIAIFRLEYYPATETHPATFSDPTGNFVSRDQPWEVPASITGLLEDAGAVAAAGEVVSESGSADESVLAPWMLIPAGVVGLTLIGGFGGYLRRRSSS